MAGALAALPLLAGLTGCAPSPMPLAEATATYDAAVADTVAALDLELLTDEDRPALQERDSDCVYYPAALELEAPDGTDLRGSAERLAPVLAEHGFGAPEPHDAPGGWSGLISEDDHGATLTVLRSTDVAVVAVEAPVDPGDLACDDTSLA